MRPLARPPWDARFEGEDAALVAQCAFGPYCAACERHLPEGAVAWNADSGRIADAQATAREWPGLLPLCPNCAAAAIAAPRPAATAAAPLRPDRDMTFTPAGPSALEYQLRPSAAADAVPERVLVVARTPAAAATVRRFALNTPVHPGGAPPTEATPDERDAYDPRLERRTVAWRHAHEAADAWLEADRAERAAVLRSISWTVRFEGFWSVWATALWERAQNEALLEALHRHPDLPATRSA
jgi:hypothetical protein